MISRHVVESLPNHCVIQRHFRRPSSRTIILLSTASIWRKRGCHLHFKIALLWHTNEYFYAYVSKGTDHKSEPLSRFVVRSCCRPATTWPAAGLALLPRSSLLVSCSSSSFQSSFSSSKFSPFCSCLHRVHAEEDEIKQFCLAAKHCASPFHVFPVQLPQSHSFR